MYDAHINRFRVQRTVQFHAVHFAVRFQARIKRLINRVTNC